MIDYECSTCKDMSFVYYNSDDYKLSDFGKASPCPACTDGGRERRRKKLHEFSRVPGRFIDAHVLDFPDLDLRRYMGESCNRRIFMLFWGSYGRGKTHALTAIVNSAIESDLVAIYATWGEILDHLRVGFSKEEDTSEFWNALLQADILAIDEVDRPRQTDYAWDRLFTLVNTRYNALDGLTIFATNKKFATQSDAIVDDIPGAFESRLRERGNVIFQLGGKDRRLTQEIQ